MHRKVMAPPVEWNRKIRAGPVFRLGARRDVFGSVCFYGRSHVTVALSTPDAFVSRPFYARISVRVVASNLHRKFTALVRSPRVGC